MSANNVPLINGEIHSWGDIRVIIMNAPVTGIKGINYSDDQAINEVKGAGNYPVGRSMGEITCEGSISLLSNELIGLEAASPTGRIQDIPEFDIVVSYIPENSTNLAIHTLKACRFKKNSRTAKQGDAQIEVEIPLAIGFIKWK